MRTARARADCPPGHRDDLSSSRMYPTLDKRASSERMIRRATASSGNLMSHRGTTHLLRLSKPLLRSPANLSASGKAGSDAPSSDFGIVAMLPRRAKMCVTLRQNSLKDGPDEVRFCFRVGITVIAELRSEF